MIVDKNKYTTRTSLLEMSALLGITRKMIVFPLEQPLEAVKTQWQADPRHKNEWLITKEIFKTKGYKGFYAGSIPNLARAIVKTTYRAPMIVGLPLFFEEHLHT